MTSAHRPGRIGRAPRRFGNQRLTNIAIAAIPLLVGAGGAAASRPGIRDWYRTIQRPDWDPPDRVFGPVWTALYAMMGVALVEVVRSDRERIARQMGLGLFAVQLLLNFGWSWIFFVEHDLRGALIEIIALWLAIVATTVAFGTTSRRAGLLLLPYLGWVSFAAILTAEIWRLNR